MKDRPFYLTTAIFYPSPKPALHSLFEAIGADAVARYRRLQGRPTRFLTGLDEHSANVERAARESGLEPRAMIDPWADSWRAAFDGYGISYDRFIRTTDEDHARASTEMVRRAMAAGDLYKGTYSGWYCPGCNEFKTDAQLVDGRCPEHPTLEPQWLEEQNYFFALSRYQERLEQLYRDRPSFCEPEHFRNEVLGWLREGLRDFSISRAGGTWGIPFPDDPEHRIYVWFDALTNYITGAGFPGDPAAFERWWPADVHVIGKNITRFHCLYWPAMLMSADLPLPRQIFAHGFMLDRGERMSKTRGNVLDPDEMASRFGVDGVRYVVLREVPFDRDGDVSYDGFVRRYNADLANDLGNLLNRTLNMTARFVDSERPAPNPEPESELGRLWPAIWHRYGKRMESLLLHEALAAVFEFVAAANRYVDSQQPWVLNKQAGGGDAHAAERLRGVLGDLLEACRLIGLAATPFMPETAPRIAGQLGVEQPYADDGSGGPPADELARWGAVGGGGQIGRSEILFPRIELDTQREV
ncbi:MAG TPA: methionine--tRNA ligase [Candidatus Limnocylindrales bacterium]|nr:methionine--tRNA ligase [Candidatus Limnocylindrales bacterium]